MSRKGNHRKQSLRKASMAFVAGCFFASCNHATTRPASKPIRNPFGEYSEFAKTSDNHVILRTKKGDRAVEVQFPNHGGEAFTEFEVPVSPAFKNQPQNEKLAGLDTKYLDRKPSFTDREISQHLPKGDPEENWQRREIESQLGLKMSEEGYPLDNQSLLASLDYVKQLFRNQRYEASLLEVDRLLIEYPTHPRLHEMRGTLLDRLGYRDLALRAWKEALKLNPENKSLEKFIAKRESAEQWRGVANE